MFFKTQQAKAELRNGPLSPVGFIRVKGHTLTPLAERFIDCARQVANSNTGHASTQRQ
jgi:hypothetical protein